MRKKISVLIIDDQQIVTDAIQDRLNDLSLSLKFRGFQKIDIANDFYRAIDFLKSANKPYDLIISDLLMAGGGLDSIPNRACGTVLNGWTFLYHFILNPDGIYHGMCKNSRIIVFSAYKRELDQYISDNNLCQLLDDIYFIEKGHIYNSNGGYVALVQTIKSLIEL